MSTQTDLLRPAYINLNGVIQVKEGHSQQQSELNSKEDLFLQISFDTTQITYEKIINLFWASISLLPESNSGSSILYYSTEQQRLISESSAWRDAQDRGIKGLPTLQHTVLIQSIPKNLTIISQDLITSSMPYEERPESDSRPLDPSAGPEGVIEGPNYESGYSKGHRGAGKPTPPLKFGEAPLRKRKKNVLEKGNKRISGNSQGAVLVPPGQPSVPHYEIPQGQPPVHLSHPSIPEVCIYISL
jgi:hypothetical protein